LAMQAGKVINPQTGEWEQMGLPFGTMARLIFIYLNSEAIKGQSPEISMGDSMTAFIRRLGLPTSGYYLNQVQEQIRRLASAQISLAWTNPESKHTVQANYGIMKAFDLWFPKDDRQRTLWTSTVRLNRDFYDDLVQHAVPLDERAIGAMHNNPMCLDIYSWLAQRLFRVPGHKPQFIGWESLRQQFGQGYANVYKFRQVFRENLKRVIALYPEAEKAVCEVINPKTGTAGGLHLFRAAPPVSQTKLYIAKPKPTLSPADKRLNASWKKGALKFPKETT